MTLLLILVVENYMYASHNDNKRHNDADMHRDLCSASSNPAGARHVGFSAKKVCYSELGKPVSLFEPVLKQGTFRNSPILPQTDPASHALSLLVVPQFRVNIGQHECMLKTKFPHTCSSMQGLCAKDPEEDIRSWISDPPSLQDSSLISAFGGLSGLI